MVFYQINYENRCIMVYSTLILYRNNLLEEMYQEEM